MNTDIKGDGWMFHHALPGSWHKSLFSADGHVVMEMSIMLTVVLAVDAKVICGDHYIIMA